MKTLIIDNYDSFTYNLYHMIADINGDVPYVIQNNSHSLDEILALDYDNIIISPGPGHPHNSHDFGVCASVLLESKVPVLGVCLGHQGLCSVFGGKVDHAPNPMHGRLSTIYHNGSALFENIPHEFKAVRYHSLVCKDNIPSCLEVTARSSDGLIMGLRHIERPLWGVQYHPESICTEHGRLLLINFNKITQSYAHISKYKLLSSHIYNSNAGEYYKINGTCNFLNKPHNLSDINQVKPKVSIKKICNWLAPKKVFDNFYSDKKNTVWLDSSRVIDGLSRFSMMGGLDGPLSYSISYDVNTDIITQRKGEDVTQFSMCIFDFLKEELIKYKIPTHTYPFQFNCGFVGYFGYELYAKTIPLKSKHISKQADAEFLFLDRMIVFDHKERTCYLLALSIDEKQNSAEKWFLEIEKFVSSEQVAGCRGMNYQQPLRAVDNSSSEDLSPATCSRDREILLKSQHYCTETNRSESSEQVAGRRDLNYQQPIVSTRQFGNYSLSRDRETYLADINRCLEYIHDGDSYEICLTNKLKFNNQIDPYSYYTSLRKLNPAPYSAYLNFSDVAIACSSIERYLLIDRDGLVESKPIKGTLPRGNSLEEDNALINKLKNNEKFKSENLMIVDLIRNDLSKVCEVGSVHVASLMEVESYETVHQLVSTVRGKLDAQLSAIDCIKASFPGGSMTGAPKLRTMEIINQLENEARGIYSGALGYLSLDGSADLNIVIRTAVITDDELSIGVGGAIIALSDAEDEYQELFLKSKSLQIALGDN